MDGEGQDAQLLLVGASYKSVPAGSTACLNLDPLRRATLEVALAGVAGLSSVVVTTCNRVELYCAATAKEPLDAAQDCFCNATGIEAANLEKHGIRMTGAEAARHLMEVCAGLDSQMIGETEIMGQVKQAYADASTHGSVGPVLHRLFQKSFQAAKHARETSGVGAGQVSLGAVAAELARRIHGDLGQSRVIVVGSGQIGADVAKALGLRGARNIVVTSRSPKHSGRLAQEIGAQTVPFEIWQETLPECDIAIFCTAAPTTLLSREAAANAVAKRRGRPVFFIDLAVPLNVEPPVGMLPDVFLYTFADLAAAANENMRGRMKEVEVCRRDLSERATKLWDDIQHRGRG